MVTYYLPSTRQLRLISKSFVVKCNTQTKKHTKQKWLKKIPKRQHRTLQTGMFVCFCFVFAIYKVLKISIFINHWSCSISSAPELQALGFWCILLTLRLFSDFSPSIIFALASCDEPGVRILYQVTIRSSTCPNMTLDKVLHTPDP